MGKKRTPLGAKCHLALTIKLVMVVISALYMLINIAAMQEDIFSVAMKALLFVVELVGMGIYVMICRRYLIAFDNNEPQKIVKITRALLAIVVLFFVANTVYLNILKDPKFAEYGFPTVVKIDYVQSALNVVLSIAIYAIILYELQKAAKGNVTTFDKWLWLAVLVINLYLLAPTFWGYCKAGVISAVIGSFILLIMVASQTLIACWITNPEKFYVDENQGVVSPAGNV